MDVGDDKDGEMELDEEEGTGPFKEKICKIIIDGGYEQKRAAKLTQDDFLQLLCLFNSHGIHFA
jgi:18S rRNA (adenine1779-N6/adenine1780-N6)-dimethyltransferase